MDGRSFEGRNIKVVWAERRDPDEKKPRRYYKNNEPLSDHVKNLLDEDIKFTNRQKSDNILL